jgi:hypothetical protein
VTPITAVAVYFSIRPINSLTSGKGVPLENKYCGKMCQFQFGTRQALFQIVQIFLNQGEQIKIKKKRLFLIY